MSSHSEKYSDEERNFDEGGHQGENHAGRAEGKGDGDAQASKDGASRGNRIQVEGGIKSEATSSVAP